MTRARLILPAVLVVVGAVILVRTALAGGGPAAFGYIFGVALVAVGAGRLYLGMSRSGV